MTEKGKAMTEAITRAVVGTAEPGKLEIIKRPADNHPSLITTAIVDAVIGSEPPQSSTEPPLTVAETQGPLIAKVIAEAAVGTGKAVPLEKEDTEPSALEKTIISSTVGNTDKK